MALVAVWISATPPTLHAVSLYDDNSSDCPIPIARPAATHTVAIAHDGGISWDGQVLAGRDALEAHMRAVGQRSLNDQDGVFVQPHPQAAYGRTVAVLAAAQRNGVVKLGILAEGASAFMHSCDTYLIE